MPLTRIFDEHEVGPEIRRIYGEIRTAFDLPFVPTVFKVCAGNPEYLRMMWKDLGPVAASKEFQASCRALQNFIRSCAISGGWSFSDQQLTLADQRVSTGDMPVLAGVVGVFNRALPSILLFVRLMQRGFSGGQPGRVSSGKQAPALSRLISLRIPSEREAGLRVWLIYSEIKRITGAKQVMDIFRAISPFPGYLASTWMDSRKILSNDKFAAMRETIAHRTTALTIGLPSHDHHKLAHGVSPAQWKDIEESVDGLARQLPGMALLCAVWRRSFAVTREPRAEVA